MLCIFNPITWHSMLPYIRVRLQFNIVILLSNVKYYNYHHLTKNTYIITEKHVLSYILHLLILPRMGYHGDFLVLQNNYRNFCHLNMKHMQHDVSAPAKYLFSIITDSTNFNSIAIQKVSEHALLMTTSPNRCVI